MGYLPGANQYVEYRRPGGALQVNMTSDSLAAELGRNQVTEETESRAAEIPTQATAAGEAVVGQEVTVEQTEVSAVASVELTA